MLFEQLLTLQAQFTQKGEATLTKHDKFGSLDCYLPVGITKCVEGVFTTIHSRRYHGDLKATVQNYGDWSKSLKLHSQSNLTIQVFEFSPMNESLRTCGVKQYRKESITTKLLTECMYKCAFVHHFCTLDNLFFLDIAAAWKSVWSFSPASVCLLWKVNVLPFFQELWCIPVKIENKLTVCNEKKLWTKQHGGRREFA